MRNRGKNCLFGIVGSKCHNFALRSPVGANFFLKSCIFSRSTHPKVPQGLWPASRPETGFRVPVFEGQSRSRWKRRSFEREEGAASVSGPTSAHVRKGGARFRSRAEERGGSGRGSTVNERNAKGGTDGNARLQSRKIKKGCNTRTSQEVTHPSTTLAQARLTAEF